MKRAVIALAIASSVACAHARVKVPAGPRVEAHLDAMPPITIAGRVVTLHAWLDDPAAAIRCPGITWTWPNGTRSSHREDCDPEERETRHSETRASALSAGVYRFLVTFDFEGRAWSAGVEVTVQ